MNFIDIILLLPLLYGFYSGYTKGLINQLTGLIGGLLSILFGIKLSGYVKVFLLENEWVNPEWSSFIGLIVTILGILLTLKLAGMIVRRTTRFIGLGFFEKIIGGLFGIAKLGLITMVLLIIFVKINKYLNILPQQTFIESVVYGYYLQLFEFLYAYWAPNNNI